MIYCDATPQTYYEYVQPNRDKWGLIAQSPSNERDGGDTAQRTGAFYAGLYFLFNENKVLVTQVKKDFEKDLDKITVAPGTFIRHPDPSKWYSNPGNFTRDQTTSLVIAMGLFGGKKELTHIRANLSHLLDNHGFYPNRLKNWDNEEKKFPFDYMDPAGPSDYAVYVRALKSENYRWFLYLGDVQTFIQAAINVAGSYIDATDTSKDLNFTLTLLQAKHQWPTFWTRAAEYVYYNYRKFSPDTPDSGHATSAVQSAWNFYYRPEASGPALHKVFQCVIDKEFTGQPNPRIYETSNKKY